MEYWKEIFKDMIQEDYYEVKLINGEEYGLIIKFQGKYNAFSVKFGEVKAVRMIDEGIVQTDIYSENEVQKYKKEKFKNMIYEVVGGQFKDEIKSIADGYLDVMDVKHYVIVTMNYNIDIISEGEPEIEIKSWLIFWNMFKKNILKLHKRQICAIHISEIGVVIGIRKTPILLSWHDSKYATNRRVGSLEMPPNSILGK